MAALADLLTRRVLTLDIERVAGRARIWDQRTRFVPISAWTDMPRTICVGYHWYGKRNPSLVAEWDDGGRGAFVRTVWELLNLADVVVTFNGKKFDLPHLKGMFAEAKLPPPTPWRNIDLYTVARQFAYESKSLDHLTRRLGVVGKRGRYDAAQAEAAVSGDERAQAALTRYCKADVKATVALYDELRPWISNHPHVGATSTATLTCPNCGSTEHEQAGAYRAVVLEYAQYRCSRCRAVFRAGHVRRIGTTRTVRDV